MTKVSAPVEPIALNTPAFETLIRSVLEERKAIKDLEASVKEHEKLLKASMISANKSSVLANGVLATISVKERSGFDLAKVTEVLTMLGEDPQSYKTKTTYETLSVALAK